MSNERYSDDFNVEAVKQVAERGHAVVDVAARLDVSQHSLYQWIKRFRVPPAERKAVDGQQAQIRRLKSELRRVSAERDILKGPQRTLPSSPGTTADHVHAAAPVRFMRPTMCKGSLRRLSPIAPGSPTSAISDPMEAGCSWLPCLTRSPGRSAWSMEPHMGHELP